MTADRSGIRFPASSGLSGRFLTDRRLKLFFALLLAASAVIRTWLSVFPKTAITYEDELFYLEIAQNLWRSGSITVYLAPIRFTKILYSILISPFYAVTDGVLRTQLISGFNAVLLSSGLVPAWFLARRMLKNNTHVAAVLLLFAFSPNLFFSLTFMAENLYLPLLMWGFYVLYRTLSAGRPGSAKPLLLGFLAFLLYLTKESGASFLFAAAVVFLISCERAGTDAEAYVYKRKDDRIADMDRVTNNRLRGNEAVHPPEERFHRVSEIIIRHFMPPWSLRNATHISRFYSR